LYNHIGDFEAESPNTPVPMSLPERFMFVASGALSGGAISCGRGPASSGHQPCLRRFAFHGIALDGSGMS
jgi:hypothetical protein